MSSQLSSVCLVVLCVVAGMSAAPWKNDTDDHGTRSLDRMAGGQEAKLGQYPYTVALTTPHGFILCGGSILDSIHVITAAHCLTGDPNIRPYSLSVVAGITNLCNRETGSQQVRRIRRFEIPEGCVISPTEVRHDIAIIRVDVPFTFNRFVQPIKLPTRYLGENQICTLTGWGTTLNRPNIYGHAVENFPNLMLPCQQRVGQLATHNVGRCRREHGNSYDVKTMICAGYTIRYPSNSDAVACEGDSGGPLIFANELHGVVSFGNGKCSFEEAGTGVYTRVSAFLPWIKQTIQRHWL